MTGAVRWMLSCMLLATAARAEVIAGVQVGRQALDVRQTVNGVTRDDTLDAGTAVVLVAGIGRPGDSGRLLAGYEGYHLGDTGDVGIFTLAYQGFSPALAATPEFELRPFLGGEAGYGWLGLSPQPGLGAGHDSGIAYGVRAGLNLVLSRQAEIELGVRYRRIGLAADQFGPAVSAHVTVDGSRGWWLGFNLGL